MCHATSFIINIEGGAKMLGKRLRELREDTNMNQTQVAKELGITQASYGLYEQEKRSPDYDTLKRLANYYRTNMAYLLGETDVKTPFPPTQSVINTTDTELQSTKILIGSKLHDLRTEKELTMKKVASVINLTAQSYSYYEKDQRSPDYETLLKLAIFFDVSVSYIFGETNKRNPFAKRNATTITKEPDCSNCPHKAEGFNDLDIEGQQKVLEFIEFLKPRHGKK